MAWCPQSLGSLRVRWLSGLALVGSLMAAAWVVEVDANHRAAHEGALRSRLETAARGLAAGIDGDSLATDRLSAEDADKIQHVAQALGFAEDYHVLRTPAKLLEGLAEQPDRPTHGRLEVVLAGGLGNGEFVCTPEWKPLFQQQIGSGERPTLLIEGEASPEEVAVYTPIVDAWGQSAGMLRIALDSHKRSVLSYAMSLTLWILVAGVALSLVLWRANCILTGHCESLEALAQGRAGDALGKFPSVEMRWLAASVTAWGENGSHFDNSVGEPLQGERHANPNTPFHDPAPALPNTPQHETLRATALQRIKGAPGAQARRTSAPQASADNSLARGAVVTQSPTEVFSPSQLIHEVVATFQVRAQRRALELRIMIGDQVPGGIKSEPTTISRALGGLLEQAIRSSRGGTILVRVSRVPESCMLRLEVNDNGVGIPWQKQASLREELNQARLRAADESKGGLALSSALAAELGGKLDFESQPGSGSRFWFTAAFLAH